VLHIPEQYDSSSLSYRNLANITGEDNTFLSFTRQVSLLIYLLGQVACLIYVYRPAGEVFNRICDRLGWSYQERYQRLQLVHRG
jgi:hypothetical protein